MPARWQVKSLPAGSGYNDLLRISPSPEVLNRCPEGTILVSHFSQSSATSFHFPAPFTVHLLQVSAPPNVLLSKEPVLLAGFMSPRDVGLGGRSVPHDLVW